MSSSLFSLETFSFLQRTASLYLTRLNRTKKIHQTITISRSDDFSKNDHLILFLFSPAWWLAHQHTHPLYWCFTGAHRPPSAASSACGGKSVSEVERRTSSGLWTDGPPLPLEKEPRSCKGHLFTEHELKLQTELLKSTWSTDVTCRWTEVTNSSTFLI